MGTQQLCLKWNKHYSNLLDISKHLLSSEALVDVTLACEGLSLKAHKLVLSACSPFFQNIFVENPCQHPVVILKGVSYADLKAIVEFMYCGEVSVNREQLSALLETAQMLQVRGLAENESDENNAGDANPETMAPSSSRNFGSNRDHNQSPNHKRKKRRRRMTGSSSDSNHSENEVKVEEPASPEVVDIDDKESSPTKPMPESRSKESGIQQHQAFSSSMVSQDASSSSHTIISDAEKQGNVVPPGGAPEVDEMTDNADMNAIKMEPVDIVDPSQFVEQSLEVENTLPSSIHDDASSASQGGSSFTLAASSKSNSEIRPCRTGLESQPHAPCSVNDPHVPRTMPQPHLSRTTVPNQQSVRTISESQHGKVRSSESSQQFKTVPTEADISMLVPFCISSESSSAGSLNESANQESMLLPVPVHEPSGSSMVGSSQQQDGVEGDSSSALMMYGDTGPPGVPSLAGPSGASQQFQGSSQGLFVRRWKRRTLHSLTTQPLCCLSCNKTFSRREYYEDHMAGHSAFARKHRCEICNETFQWRNQLYRHKRQHESRFDIRIDHQMKIDASFINHILKIN